MADWKNRWAPAAGLLLALALGLSACAPESAADAAARALHLDLSRAETIASTDSHGGIQGDGTTYLMLRVPADALLAQIRGRDRWRPFPMEETARILAYGVADEQGSMGPYLGDVALPDVQNGYYCLIDRHSERQTALLERASFHFTLAIYDMDTGILHICLVDT